jgi:hypothetical protein
MQRVHERILTHLETSDIATTDELLETLEPEGDVRARKRLLYHLQQLERAGEIAVIERRAHGLKVYRRITTRMIGHTPPTIFEEQGVFVRANENAWGSSVDSIVIDGSSRDRMIERMILVSKVSDAICITDPNPENERLFEAIGKRDDIEITISLSAPSLNEWYRAERLELITTSRAHLIIRVTAAQFSNLTFRSALNKSAELAIESGGDWYVQNLDAHPAPLFIGKLGPHTFDAHETSDEKLLVCTQNTYCVDVNRFLRHHPLSELRHALLSSMEAIGRTNIAVRSRIEDIIPEEYVSKETLSLSRTYVRFWNYGLKEPTIEQETVLMLLKSTKETLEQFATGQETIYTSCGMPLRFRLGFAPLFSSAIPRSFSSKRFARLQISSTNQLMNETTQHMLRDREHTSALFSGGDRVRIHRHPDVDSETILRESLWLHKTYSLPLVCYSFKKDTSRTLLDYSRWNS